MDAVEIVKAQIFREKPEKHQTASNSKYENRILFLTKTEIKVEQKPQQTTKPKLFGTKTDLKKWLKRQNWKGFFLRFVFSKVEP